jgi:hypothetical protein
MIAAAHAIAHPAVPCVLVRIGAEGPVEGGEVARLLGLAARGMRIVFLAGRGEPGGEPNPALSLRPLAGDLSRQFGRVVEFVPDCCGAGAEARIADLPAGGLALLENLRFHPDAKRRSRVFALRLSALGDHFIDLGPPPRLADGWQDHLLKILPAPPAQAN